MRYSFRRWCPLLTYMDIVEELLLCLLVTDQRSHDVRKYGNAIKDTTCQDLI